jgi:hypothetical protein
LYGRRGKIPHEGVGYSLGKANRPQDHGSVEDTPKTMNTLLLIIVLLLLFGGGGFYIGGPAFGGGGIGLILLICIIIYLMGGFRSKN